MAVGSDRPLAAAGARDPDRTVRAGPVWLPILQGPGGPEVAFLRDRVRGILRQWSSSGAQTGASAERQRAVTTAPPSAGPISGYMEFHFNAVEGQDAVLDFHRFVLLFSHSFSDRVRFVAELELEHAVVSNETDGELELEQDYIDFLMSWPFNLRGGMVLAPVGIINERHDNEARPAGDGFAQLAPDDRAALLAFLDSL
jgi:hypothetical protein